MALSFAELVELDGALVADPRTAGSIRCGLAASHALASSTTTRPGAAPAPPRNTLTHPHTPTRPLLLRTSLPPPPSHQVPTPPPIVDQPYNDTSRASGLRRTSPYSSLVARAVQCTLRTSRRTSRRTSSPRVHVGGLLIRCATPFVTVGTGRESGAHCSHPHCATTDRCRRCPPPRTRAEGRSDRPPPRGGGSLVRYGMRRHACPALGSVSWARAEGARAAHPEAQAGAPSQSQSQTPLGEAVAEGTAARARRGRWRWMPRAAGLL